MKKVKIILIILAAVLSTVASAAVGLSIWANQPRGVRIHISNI